MSKNRLFILFLALLMLITLVACGGGDATEETPTEEETTTEETTTDETDGEEATTEEQPADSGEKVTLTIESWRNDDLAIWQDILIPAFNEKFPDIEVVFSPSAPTEYDGALNTRLEGGVAGDLITCRPFDRSLALFDQGHLASLNDLEGMANFGSVAKSAWVTDDGSDVFCVADGICDSWLYLQPRYF